MTDSIKKKIAALLAKAEGTDNEFEASTFMAKVNELLEKHQIEMHEVRKAQGDQDPMGKEKGETNLYASMGWSLDVAAYLAKFYGCKFLYWKRGNHFIYEILGRESARTTFELMFPFILSQVKQQGKRAWLSGNFGSQSAMTRQVAQALCVRIARLTPVVEETRASNESKGLVPVTDLVAAMNEFYPEVKTTKAKEFNYGYAAQEAASKVSLNVQATGKHVKLIG